MFPFIGYLITCRKQEKKTSWLTDVLAFAGGARAEIPSPFGPRDVASFPLLLRRTALAASNRTQTWHAGLMIQNIGYIVTRTLSLGPLACRSRTSAAKTTGAWTFCGLCRTRTARPKNRPPLRTGGQRALGGHQLLRGCGARERHGSKPR